MSDAHSSSRGSSILPSSFIRSSASDYRDFALQYFTNRTLTSDKTFELPGCRERSDRLDKIAMALALLERADRRYHDLTI